MIMLYKQMDCIYIVRVACRSMREVRAVSAQDICQCICSRLRSPLNERLSLFSLYILNVSILQCFSSQQTHQYLLCAYQCRKCKRSLLFCLSLSTIHWSDDCYNSKLWSLLGSCICDFSLFFICCKA